MKYPINRLESGITTTNRFSAFSGWTAASSDVAASATASNSVASRMALPLATNSADRGLYFSQFYLSICLDFVVCKGRFQFDSES